MYSKEEAKLLKQDFWEGFDRYTKFYSKKVGNPIQWLFYKTGIKGLELKFDITKKLIQVILEVNPKSENRRFDIYLELNKYKAIIENEFEEGLIWEDDFIKDEGVVVSRVLTENNEFNFHNKDHWPDIYKFMAKNMYQLQCNVEEILPILKETLVNDFI